MLRFLRSSHIRDSMLDGMLSYSGDPLKRGHDLPLPVIASPLTSLILEIALSSFMTASVCVMVLTR